MRLAIDTCFEGCSAALYDDLRGIIAARFERMERGHAEALGPMVEALFAEAGTTPKALKNIIVTKGPGTFTGLRIGLAYAKGMALALNIPLHGIDSLTATALPHQTPDQKLLVVQKAGASQFFYWACYDGATQTHAPALATAQDIANHITQDPWRVCGSGAETLKQLSPHLTIFMPDLPDAKTFASYTASDEPVEPLYLRAPDAKKSVDAKSQVRLATTNDFKTLADIHAQSFTTAWTNKDLSALLTTPGAGALVVELAGTIYGFVQFQWVAGEAEINTICVSPNHRRQHFGSDLMDGLLAYLDDIKTTRIFLEVAADNTAAITLYEKLGFTRIGIRKKYYSDGQDAITMSRDLST
jgi:tRNA threonylcarbamoyl adenosine modification protein YeaZ/ribosomal-protein-alanine acetyltransferase